MLNLICGRADAMTLGSNQINCETVKLISQIISHFYDIQAGFTLDVANDNFSDEEGSDDDVA